MEKNKNQKIPYLNRINSIIRFPLRVSYRLYRNLADIIEELYITIRYRRGEFQTISWHGLKITETRHDPYIKKIAFGHTQTLKDQIEIFQSLIVNEKSVIFDIGANVGIVTMLASQIKGSTVYSFEPGSRAYSCLTRNINQNLIGNVITINMGMSDREGKKFIAPPSGNQHPRYLKNNLKTGLYSVHANKNSKEAKDFGENANFTSIDTFCALNKIDTLDYIKIDVEGHENEVLKGGRNTFINKRPICQIEYNSMTINIADKDPKEIFDILSDIGYSTFLFERNAFVEISFPKLIQRYSTSLPDIKEGRIFIGFEIYAFPIEKTPISIKT